MGEQRICDLIGRYYQLAICPDCEQVRFGRSCDCDGPIVAEPVMVVVVVTEQHPNSSISRDRGADHEGEV